ncbi:MAG TPA: LytR C-terminal domain-containing protein [Acidimicrobiales bacterium]|nr:LytR C-terminal domain-containing protein [Acidimicrobiales bacterium]
MQPGRGAALLVVAVLLGIVLLNAADDAPPDRVAAGTSKDDGESEVTTSTGVTTTVVILPVRAPADVKVISANGTDTKGVARKATDQLKAVGYNVLSPTDAPKTAASAVYFAGDFQREAEGVAANLGLPPTSVQPVPTPGPLADPRGADVIVVVGPELAQTLARPTTASTTAGATTTTTAARTTSSTTRP